MWDIDKRYKLENLCSSIADIHSRVRKIENYTNRTLSPVKFYVGNEFIMRKTRRISQVNAVKRLSTHDFNRQLIGICNQIYRLELVHGDIHYKNIFLSGKELVLSDWEPCLRQCIRHRKVLMYTSPYIDPRDRTDNVLTHRTDLMCCYLIVNRCTLGFFHTARWAALSAAAFASDSPFDICMVKHI